MSLHKAQRTTPTHVLCPVPRYVEMLIMNRALLDIAAARVSSPEALFAAARNLGNALSQVDCRVYAWLIKNLVR